MATIFENKNRIVVPNWRRFDKTSQSGELNSAGIKKKSEKKPKGITLKEDYIEAWKGNKTDYHAGDLLGAYVVNNIPKDEYFFDAAEFINKSSSANSIQKNLVNHLLNDEPVLELKNKITTIDQFVIDSSANIIYNEINRVKNNIVNFPYDYINYIEIARLYSIIGLKEKAIKNVNIALNITKNDRYVLRSASRMFAHYGELDQAHDILRKSPLIKVDPWIVSSEIAISYLKGRSSNNIKRGGEMIKSNSFTALSITELASSMGTLELMNGSLKNSRSLFSKALVEPNSNSMAQIEWATEQDKFMQVDVYRSSIMYNYEAIALDMYNRNNFTEAIDFSEQWFLDMPFTKRPIFLGTKIAIQILDNQELGVKFCKAGLVAHPKDIMLNNNAAYSLALLNRTTEAQQYLDKIPKNINDDVSKACVLATQGLIFFRKGFYDFGRLYYKNAAEIAKNTKNVVFLSVAVLNSAREEIIIKSSEVESVMYLVERVPSVPGHIEIDILKNKVISMYKKMKEGGS